MPFKNWFDLKESIETAGCRTLIDKEFQTSEFIMLLDSCESRCISRGVFNLFNLVVVYISGIFSYFNLVMVYIIQLDEVHNKQKNEI